MRHSSTDVKRLDMPIDLQTDFIVANQVDYRVRSLAIYLCYCNTKERRRPIDHPTYGFRRDERKTSTDDKIAILAT